MSLKQAVDIIKDGKIFVIHTTDAMRAFTKEIENLDIDSQTVAYFDCNHMPGLLDEGEWEWYLTQAEENSEIKDLTIRKRLAEQKNVPHKEYYNTSS
jgi:hypothetical protein